MGQDSVIIAEELRNVHDIFTLMGHDLGIMSLELMIRKYETLAKEFEEDMDKLYLSEQSHQRQAGQHPVNQ
jgi:hypothetical protein